MRCSCRPLGLVYLLAGSLLLASEPEVPKQTHGMVVAQEPLAAGVGIQILKRGGNAVDAAIAVGFALAVTHPVAGNLGGGGFMLIRMADGRTDFLDFREAAPGLASHDMYLDASGKVTQNSIYGWTSSGVPGTVAGFALATRSSARCRGMTFSVRQSASLEASRSPQRSQTSLAHAEPLKQGSGIAACLSAERQSTLQSW